MAVVSVKRSILHNQLALVKFGRCEQYTIDSIVYLSNRPHWWVYRRDSPRGMFGEREKELEAFSQWITQSLSTTSSPGLFPHPFLKGKALGTRLSLSIVAKYKGFVYSIQFQ